METGEQTWEVLSGWQSINQYPGSVWKWMLLFILSLISDVNISWYATA